jgi:hypothetical protein
MRFALRPAVFLASRVKGLASAQKTFSGVIRRLRGVARGNVKVSGAHSALGHGRAATRYDSKKAIVTDSLLDVRRRRD